MFWRQIFDCNQLKDIYIVKLSELAPSISPSKIGEIPGPRVHAYYGNLRDFAKGPTRFFMDCALNYGQVCRYQLGRRKLLLFSNPADVHYILNHNWKNYHKSRSYKQLSLILGDGLITADGRLWQTERKLVQPAFHKSKINDFAGIMVRLTHEKIQSWKNMEKREINMGIEMTDLTLNIVSEILLGGGVRNNIKELFKSLNVINRFVPRRVQKVFKLPLFVPTKENQEFLTARKFIHGIIQEIIDKRRQHGEGNFTDLLNMLISASDDNDSKNRDRLLRDHITTFFLAGHETSATTLMWIWYLLDKHPDERAKLKAEISEVLGDRSATADDYPRLPYAVMVIKEAMRLYPPQWVIGRRAVAADNINGLAIPANTNISISPYVLHNHPAFWDEPEAFKPERFIDFEKKSAVDKFCYIPFGAGPRLCIGDHFAMLEILMVVVTVMQNLEFSLSPGQEIFPVPMQTLRPNINYNMRF